MNELQRLLRACLPSDFGLISVRRDKGNMHGRPSNEVIVRLRDNVTGRVFDAVWHFANDLKMTSEHVVTLMAKNLVEDLHNFRRNNS